MLALAQISSWHWIGFLAFVLFFVAMDLGVFHRHAHVVRFREALSWTVAWFLLAMVFALFIRKSIGHEESVEFTTGYILELSLSMDNVLVIALIFPYFRVPLVFQHRILFWGILGALVMRGAIIAMGAALIHRFQWILLVFGAFLVLSAIKMIFSNDDGAHPEKNVILKVIRKFFPVSEDFDGEKFLTQHKGRTALTPLALVLIMVETTDLIFAVDSIPAIFAVTENAYVVFTSNMFAILGLRSLYFVLAGAIGYFRYLKLGLSIVLMFIGGKMLVHKQWSISPTVSLYIVASIIGLSVLVSLIAAVITRRKAESNKDDD
ncbi:MAG: hypothetical protein JWM04_1965 [Verrucomicrobiales bacterium]|nr:hypothetical protein [Verrucomicrobiales bacterium]